MRNTGGVQFYDSVGLHVQDFNGRWRPGRSGRRLHEGAGGGDQQGQCILPSQGACASLRVVGGVRMRARPSSDATRAVRPMAGQPADHQCHAAPPPQNKRRQRRWRIWSGWWRTRTILRATWPSHRRDRCRPRRNGRLLCRRCRRTTGRSRLRCARRCSPPRGCGPAWLELAEAAAARL
jgi:hypothetical protein